MTKYYFVTAPEYSGFIAAKNKTIAFNALSNYDGLEQSKLEEVNSETFYGYGLSHEYKKEVIKSVKQKGYWFDINAGTFG